MKEQLWQISTSYACAGIIVKNGIVIRTAPIYGWMKGKALAEVLRWRKITKAEEVKSITP